MSADLDALDRGVIEAGVTAAEALSRVAALEAQVAALTEGLRLASGRPDPAGPARRPRLEVVKP